MQKRPPERLHQLEMPRYTLSRSGVDRITNDGMTDLAQMDADLMGAPGRDDDGEERDARERLRVNDARYGRSSASGPRRDPFALNRIASDGQVDCPSGAHSAPHERHVSFVHFTVAELTRQRGVGPVVFRNHHQARCAAVESMDDTRAKGAADAAQIVYVVEQCVDERTRGMTGGGVNHHTRWLVDNEKVGVVVHDVDIQSFGLGSGGDRRRDFEGDPITLANWCLSTSDHGPHARPRVFDESLDLRARQVGEVCHKHVVDPTPRVLV